jgi:cytochrome bd-type quinol oxidase subunit 2
MSQKALLLVPVLFVLIWLAYLDLRHQSAQLKRASKLVGWWLAVCLPVFLITGWLGIVVGLGENMPRILGILAPVMLVALLVIYVGIIPALIWAHNRQRKHDKSASKRASPGDAPIDQESESS